MKMKLRKYLIFPGLFLINLFPIPGAFWAEEKHDQKNPFDANVLTAEIRKLWPDGNCAENITGDKHYIQISLACNGNFTGHHRGDFLSTVGKTGWILEKENYRIDPLSANYFYKFESRNFKLYIKLFLRNSQITWPLHENHRPQIAILLNNLKTPDDLLPWANIKLPLSVSIPVLDSDFETLSHKALEMQFDPWVLFSRKIESIEDNHGDLESLAAVLGAIPEENFYFTGIMLPPESAYHNDTKNLRALFYAMKKIGIRKFLGQPTLEVADTSRILDINTITAVFHISGNSSYKDLWKQAFDHAKDHGYAVIILDAGDAEARNFLLNSIQETLSFIDYVNLTRLPIPENLLNRK